MSAMSRPGPKIIAAAADLAINGAQPAFAEPLHVGRPNVGGHDKFLELARRVLESRSLTNNGPLVVELERRLADYLGVPHCIAVNNGTIALEIAIRALGLSGEVIVPSYTFVATAHALYGQGISPVFADIDPSTHNLDPDALRARITPATSGIIGVHLWGRASPIDDLEAIAAEHGLQLMFDAAHAFGCAAGSRKIGNFGRAEVMSFHATKFFNTFEGGAIVTHDEQLAESMRLMRNFGFAGYDDVVSWGTNGKMTEICAAMGLTNLDALDGVVAVNRRNYIAYREMLAGIEGLELAPVDDTGGSNFQYVVVEVGPGYPLRRDELVAVLHAENVFARRYFWPGCHRMQPYARLQPDVGALLPQTEAVAERVIVLPTGTAVEVEDIDRIGDIIRKAAAFR